MKHIKFESNNMSHLLKIALLVTCIKAPLCSMIATIQTTQTTSVPTVQAGIDALCDAIKDGARKRAEDLIQHGVDVNAVGQSGLSPLCTAAMFGRIGAIKALMQAGAKVDAKIPDGYLDGTTALGVAVARGNYTAAQCLIQKYHANAKIVNHRNGWTLLHFAVLNDICPSDEVNPWNMQGKPLVIKMLLTEMGLNVNARTKTGQTVLHKAATGCSAEIIELLIAHGADVNAKNEKGKTPLHKAAFEGNVIGICTLLDKGADPDSKDNKGLTPLAAAKNANQLQAVYILSKPQSAKTGHNRAVKEIEKTEPVKLRDVVQKLRKSRSREQLSSTNNDANLPVSAVTTDRKKMIQIKQEIK